MVVFVFFFIPGSSVVLVFSKNVSFELVSVSVEISEMRVKICVLENVNEKTSSSLAVCM